MRRFLAVLPLAVVVALSLDNFNAVRLTQADPTLTAEDLQKIAETKPNHT